jgi:hypothetical protein
MEILTNIKTPKNFNSEDIGLMNAAEEEILQNPEFMKLKREHKFGACYAEWSGSNLHDFWLENADGFIKVIF